MYGKSKGKRGVSRANSHSDWKNNLMGGEEKRRDGKEIIRKRNRRVSARGVLCPDAEHDAQSGLGEGGKRPVKVRDIREMDPARQSPGHGEFPLPHHGAEATG